MFINWSIRFILVLVYPLAANWFSSIWRVHQLTCPIFISDSYSFYMDSFHSSWEVASSKEVGSLLVDKFNSQSDEASMLLLELESPKVESSTLPLSSCLVKVLVHVFPISSGWTLSSAFMAILKFCEMVLHYLPDLTFQFLQSHNPTDLDFLMKWKELVHEGEMWWKNDVNIGILMLALISTWSTWI